jgi:antitoxin VapB
MALTIDNPEVEELARELASQTGESIEEAVATAIREWLNRRVYYRAEGKCGGIVNDPVVDAIRERMSREPRPDSDSARAAIREIQDYLMKLPVLDSRSADEILGYDESGLPH